eukprot:GHVP01055582.1.p1 GENE.GHVP01055582.1~~GHVP01055582.1.p1  ORF type:complete len:138 (+),score=13.63 GHVP01055582.1:68-481(+)
MSHSKRNQFSKTKICPWFHRGICEKGEDCKFAHSEVELRNRPNLERTSMCKNMENCRSENCKFAHDASELRATADVWKTKLCHMHSRGKCSHGMTCRHAHGRQDIRAHIFEERSQQSSTQSLGSSLSVLFWEGIFIR